MGRCAVAVLGGFEVRVDGNLVPGNAWRSRRARRPTDELRCRTAAAVLA